MGFDLFKDTGKLISDAANASGHAINTIVTNPGKALSDVAGGVEKGANFVADAVQKIPIVGPVYHGVLSINAAPFKFAGDIIGGKNVGQAFVDGFKQDVAAAHEVAPVAQAVISFVPGVGPLASSAIGAGLALAAGAPMDEIAMSAIKGAIPGGALVGAAYDVGRAAIVDHKVGNLAALVSVVGKAAGVEIPPAATAALTGGLSTLRSVANGQKPDVAVLNAAAQAAPGLLQGLNLSSAQGQKDAADRLVAKGEDLMGLSGAQQEALHKALQIGIAVQHASNLQKTEHRAIAKPQEQARLTRAGQSQLDPVSSEALASLHGKGTKGFLAGHGLMQHQATPFEIRATRERFDSEDQHGFDLALSLHIGRVATPVLPTRSPAVAAGYAITHGSRNATAAHRAALANTIAITPGGASGVKVAKATLKSSLWVDIAVVAVGAAIGAVAGGPLWAGFGGCAGIVVDLIRRK
jgi:hypothetical protein